MTFASGVFLRHLTGGGSEVSQIFAYRVREMPVYIHNAMFTTGPIWTNDEFKRVTPRKHVHFGCLNYVSLN